MRLVRFLQDQNTKIGFLFGEQVFELPLSLDQWQKQTSTDPTTLLEKSKGLTDIVCLLQESESYWNDLQHAYAYWNDNLSKLQVKGIPIQQARLLPPLGKPGKMICVGLNYPSAGQTNPDEIPPYPVLFHKVTTALTGHNTPIIHPRISQHVDYEGELAIIIGKPGKNITRQQALSYLAGFTIANDVGARDVQARSSQWTSGKMFDTFCPLGPAMVSSDKVPNPDQLRIQTSLNDRLVQDDTTARMIFDVSYLISYISTLTSLEPGDLILTGSPKCVGREPDPRLPLRPGDIIEVHIENLGVLTNKVSEDD